jgi:hypothetical protein
MPFTRFDDGYADHPKLWALTDGAFRLQTAAIIHCNRFLTDGRIDATEVPRLVPRYRRTALEELLTKGLWTTNGAGYQIHDFLDWNASRSTVEKGRKQARARQANWRNRPRGEDP